MERRKYRKAVFVVVYAKTERGVEYLILKRRHHWKGWEFPKGGINFNEANKHSARRETTEETGLIPRRIRKFNYSGRYKYRKKFADRTGIIGQTFSLYAAEVKKGKVKIDKKEHSGYEWMDFREAVKKVRFPNQKNSLRIVNEWISKR